MGRLATHNLASRLLALNTARRAPEPELPELQPAGAAWNAQLTATSDTFSFFSLRAVPCALGSSVGFPSTTNR